MNDNLKSVITCDVDGKVETFSKGAVNLFGYTEEEVVGKMRVSDFSDGQVVLGHVVGWLAEAVEKGVWEGETVFLHKFSISPLYFSLYLLSIILSNESIYKPINCKY